MIAMIVLAMFLFKCVLVEKTLSKEEILVFYES